jgi:hypothetical protein
MRTIALAFALGVATVAGACNPVQIAEEPTAPDAGTDATNTAPDGGGVQPVPDAGLADAGPGELLDAAQGIANAGAECTQDSDCCVVISRCRDEAFIVGLAEDGEVASLVSQFDTAALAAPGGSLPPSAECVHCIAPSVQVSCVQHQCVGAVFPFILPDGGGFVPPPSLSQNHCGSVSLAEITPNETGLLLGCGATEPDGGS